MTPLTYESTVQAYYNLVTSSVESWFILCGICVLYGIGVYVLSLHVRNPSYPLSFTIFGIVIASISMALILKHQGGQLTKWRQDYAIPYINSLEVKTLNLPDTFINILASSNLSKVYEVTVENESLPIEITDIVYRNIDNPRLRYRLLEEDLPAGFDRGYYTVTLELPKNFGFEPKTVNYLN